MGRLSKSTPSVRVNYKKLVDELGGSCDSLKIMPALPDYFSYCCHHCGHTQKLQAKTGGGGVPGEAMKAATRVPGGGAEGPMDDDAAMEHPRDQVTGGPPMESKPAHDRIIKAMSSATRVPYRGAECLAEELNSIVGNAFKMAYAAQLQKQTSFQDVIASQLDQTQTDKVLWTKELSALKKDKSPIHTNHHKPTEMDIQLSNTDPSTLRLAPPSTIPGLKPVHTHKYNVLGPTMEKVSSQQSTPSSDESNSPTEMNSYKKMTEKPPLIKRIAMGLTGNVNHNDEDSCPLVSDSNTSSTPGSPTNRPLSGGYVNEEEAKNKSNNTVDNLKNEITTENNSNLSKHIEMDNSLLSVKQEKEFKCKRISQISSSSSSSGPQTGTENTLIGFTPSPPPLPERTDSLNNKEQGELRLAPWFQAGIPREIALEILGQEPVGAFMVRESTSKPGCFALSLRVPRTFQPTGIAHYLIVRANKGYKIKGFTKEFTSLTSLITHHSVMPELLPCPLSLSRYHPSFVKTDSKRDFADIDLDPDYNTLADFRKMMADLNV